MAGELAEDPGDLFADTLLHALEHLGSGTVAFLALYLLLHGVVKLMMRRTGRGGLSGADLLGRPR